MFLLILLISLVNFIYATNENTIARITGSSVNENSNSGQNNNSGCKQLYWFDDTNKNCEQKQFCGMYMYQNLQTFDSKEACLAGINNTTQNINICGQDMKECSNGFLVGRNSDNGCEFDECPKNNSNTHCAANGKACGKAIGLDCCGNMECYYPKNESAENSTGICISNPNQIWNRFISENGEEFEIEKNESGINERIRSRNITSHTYGLNITPEQDRERNQTKLKVKLSNGRNAEIKIMPDVASQVALEKLRLKCETRNCTLELKEVGNNKVAYELNTEKQAKILALIKSKMQVKAQVDAETGELIRVKKPWWAFLATEEQETA